MSFPSLSINTTLSPATKGFFCQKKAILSHLTITPHKPQTTKMQFSAVLLLAFTALTTALPQPAALSLTLSPRQVGTVVTNVTCTPGATSCEDCPPHEDGFPPNCVVSHYSFSLAGIISRGEEIRNE